ncbi:hypothetical protein CYMTET_55688 [Cymbomonas tetramitiformis]|uniref:Uncharacterized protein n=1 Tax=Cymbomonas tetramitiformis TaxID=36881 RepID=A0AAE0BDK5_9CHLO|nr:hypothetical protein CYMTET_55688 [Cymbomonas tetramitiformis]
MGTMMGTLILLNATCSHNATIRETLQLGNGAPNDDWWNAALCNELATELQGETRYELRLPPADNGESFFVPGLVSFTRPALHSANAKLKERAMKCIATHAARLTHNKRKELAAKRRRENRRKTLQLSDSSGMQLDDTAPEGKGKGILYGPAPPPDVGTGSMPLLTAAPQADMASASSAGTGSMPLLTATPQADMANASSAVTGSMPLLTATPQADMANASSAGTGSMPLLTATPQADMANASSAACRCSQPHHKQIWPAHHLQAQSALYQCLSNIIKHSRSLQSH